MGNSARSGPSRATRVTPRSSPAKRTAASDAEKPTAKRVAGAAAAAQKPPIKLVTTVRIYARIIWDGLIPTDEDFLNEVNPKRQRTTFHDFNEFSGWMTGGGTLHHFDGSAFSYGAIYSLNNENDFQEDDQWLWASKQHANKTKVSVDSVSEDRDGVDRIFGDKTSDEKACSILNGVNVNENGAANGARVYEPESDGDDINREIHGFQPIIDSLKAQQPYVTPQPTLEELVNIADKLQHDKKLLAEKRLTLAPPHGPAALALIFERWGKSKRKELRLNVRIRFDHDVSYESEDDSGSEEVRESMEVYRQSGEVKSGGDADDDCDGETDDEYNGDEREGEGGDDQGEEEHSFEELLDIKQAVAQASLATRESEQKQRA